MSQRRMFSPKIVGSDAFLEMPVSARELYFQLGMYADDDGFINPKKIVRMIGASEDDIKVLIAKRFVLPFENGVVVIKHWAINNLIRKDFYRETIYTEERLLLTTKENGAYTEGKKEIVNKNVTNRSRRLGKDRLGKVRTVNPVSEQSSPVKELMTLFYEINPTMNWGNKTTLKACRELITRFGFEGTMNMARQIIAVQGKPYAPVATTPYQMKEKLTQFKIYFDSEKGKDNKNNVFKV